MYASIKILTFLLVNSSREDKKEYNNREDYYLNSLVV